jgi:hypothetical protein
LSARIRREWRGSHDRDVLVRAERWPDWAQEALAEIAADMDREVQAGTYRAIEAELRKIDEARRSAARRARKCGRG